MSTKSKLEIHPYIGSTDCRCKLQQIPKQWRQSVDGLFELWARSLRNMHSLLHSSACGMGEMQNIASCVGNQGLIRTFDFIFFLRTIASQVHAALCCAAQAT